MAFADGCDGLLCGCSLPIYGYLAFPEFFYCKLLMMWEAGMGFWGFW